MKFKLLTLTKLLVVCTLILPSGMWLVQEKSGANGTKAQEASETYQIYLPIVVVDLPPVIPETTVTLSDDSIDQLTISEDGMTFTFVTETSELANVDEGYVIAGDVSDKFPDGFLRKVISRHDQDGQVVLVTEEAKLEDSIQDGAIHTSQNLNPEDVSSEILQPGVSILADSNCEGFGYSLDTVLYSDDSYYVKAKGDICFSTIFYFDLSIKNFELKRLTFTNTITQTAFLEIESNIEFSGNKEVIIATKKFTPKTFWIGIVPVVITPELIVYVGMDGSVTAGISTNISQEAVLTSGLKYASDTGWDTVWDFTNNFNPLTNVPPSINMTFKVYAGTKLRLRLYGAAAPYVKAQVYLKLCVDTLENPSWTLDAGLEVAAGFDVLIRFEIVPFETTIFDHSWRLMPPHEPENPSPTDGATNERTNVLLSWTSPDTSIWNYLGPDVIFNLYLEAGDSSPDDLVSSGTELFYAISLNSYTKYYWRVEAVGNFGTTTIGPVWNFTTGESDMVLIWGGEFMMGCRENILIPDFKCELMEWEMPQHDVFLDEFFIDKTEVTNAQYAQCVTAGVCTPPVNNTSFSRDSYYGNSDYDLFPVVNVNWTQAEEYCTWKGLRLPTEAEWERAASAYLEWPFFPWGGDLPGDCSDSKANINNCYGDTLPIASFPSGASYFGVLDLGGNVWEWVSDWFSPTYYSDCFTEYPDGILNPTGPESGDYKVIRGGAFYNTYEDVRTAKRAYGYGADYFTGFRCAKSVTTPTPNPSPTPTEVP